MGHIALASVDSTNAEAFRRASALDRPTWISAGLQTAGRGRRAQPWTSPPGNLYATLVMPVSEAPQIVALRSFAAAIALRIALTEVIGPAATLTLKWPNDVLLNGGKVAGILLEAQSTPSQTAPAQTTPVSTTLAIGIGVNLATHPDPADGAAFPPVSVHAQTGHTVTPETFLTLLAVAYARQEAIFQTSGFTPIRAEWLAHAARLGQPIRARTGTQTRDGTFTTIDHGGNLVLQMASGPVAIPAAEVFF